MLLMAGLLALLGYLRVKKLRKPEKTIDSLMTLDLPTGVDIEIKTVGGRA